MFQSPQQPSCQAQILVVDDGIDNLELLSTICKLQGYETIKSDCGKLAVELARSNIPDLILLDISMPGIDGYTVCQLLKKDPSTQDIPIVFISVFKEIENKTQAFKLGGNDYITKPFQIEDVIVRIKTQLKFRDLQKELKAQHIQLDREKQARQVAEVRLLELNQRLSELTTLDELTKIANRHYFDETLTKEWHRAQREKFSLGLILCDLDYFQLYNDAFGSEVGDLCLQQVAKTIAQIAEGSGGLAVRYDGDMFAVILSPTIEQNTLGIAENIRQQIIQLQIFHPNSPIGDRISLSIGATLVIPNLKQDCNRLLRTAERALEIAQAKGDCVTLLPMSQSC